MINLRKCETVDLIPGVYIWKRIVRFDWSNGEKIIGIDKILEPNEELSKEDAELMIKTLKAKIKGDLGELTEGILLPLVKGIESEHIQHEEY